MSPDRSRGLAPGTQSCSVCKSYDLEPVGGSKSVDYEIKASATAAETDMWWQYEPLTDYPELFLSFSSLYQKEHTVRTASKWVHSYGLLGIGADEDIDPREARIVTAESTGSFFTEVRRTAAILAAYEAHLSRDSEQARLVTREWFAEFADSWWSYYRDELGGMEEPNGGYLGFAHTFAVLESERMAWRHARSGISVDVISYPSRVGSHWALRGPLGAIYLQMNWLIRAEEPIGRCLYCGGPMALSSSVLKRPKPGKQRKTRSDKTLCSDRCSQAYRRRKRAQNS